MALETVTSNELLNFIIYDTISATPFTCNQTNNPSTTKTNIFFHLHKQNLNPNNSIPPEIAAGTAMANVMTSNSSLNATTTAKMSMAVQSYCNTNNSYNLQVQKKKKKRRRSRVCKNKEEAESQRMSHIAVERNRRKQMNQHLAVLRSLMPQSHVQRGDQASIVGGAIEFVKELEHLLQALEAQKFISTHQQDQADDDDDITKLLSSTTDPPFSQFFCYPQYTCSQIPSKNSSKSKDFAAIADIEVSLIETHANLRILSRKRLAQLSKMVACFQTLLLNVLHLNVTTLDPLVLYSISLKVEEGCRVNSAEEIANAVHQMLTIIEQEATRPMCF